MRELTFLRSKVLEWREVQEPGLASTTDAIVRPFIAARCDGDASFLRHDLERLLRAGALIHAIDEAFRGPATNPFSAPFAYGMRASPRWSRAARTCGASQSAIS